MVLLNNAAHNDWIMQVAVTEGDIIDYTKGIVFGELVNITGITRRSQEIFNLEWAEE